jgi:putative ABC transport system permease protein
VTRRSELAVRGALGASRGRLARQLVTESVLLALLGGTLGLGLAAMLQRVLPLLLRLGRSMVTAHPFHLDPRVLAFAVGLSLVTGVAVGLFPALRGTRSALFEELKSGARTVDSGGGARARLVLVAIQVGLSVVLLLGSALLIRSFGKLMRAELGFDADRLLTTSLALPATVTNDEAIQFYTTVVGQVRALPGVTGAGIVDQLPVHEPGGSLEIWTPEHPGQRSFSRQALGRLILPGYLAAMRMPLVAGRDLAITDREGSRPVMVINQTMARILFEGEPPLGHTVLIGSSPPIAFEVVGVVADAQLNEVGHAPQSTMYLSFLQYPSGAMHMVIRTDADPRMIAGALRDLVAKQRGDVPVDDFATMKSIIRDSTLAERVLTAIVACFALFALLLAAVGLFGVLSYQVNQRRHELGLRMALGANRAHVLTTALRQGLLATAAGLVGGAVAGLALARPMAGLLFGITPADPASAAGALACLIAVALAACLLQALQAASLEPMQALRYE